MWCVNERVVSKMTPRLLTLVEYTIGGSSYMIGGGSVIWLFWTGRCKNKISMHIDIVWPVMKDVSQASAISMIPISCRRLMSMLWLIVSKAADNQVAQVLSHMCCQGWRVSRLWFLWVQFRCTFWACMQIGVNEINCLMLDSLLVVWWWHVRVFWRILISLKWVGSYWRYWGQDWASWVWGLW